jgi:hypothetical protein
MAKTKAKGPEILTANELLSGRVVFWTGSGWSEDRHAAIRAATDEARAALTATGKAEEARNVVVAAYSFEIDAATGEPVELRERRRLAGPSILLPTPIRTAA